MTTDQKIITVSENPPGTQDGIKADPKRRPAWMIDGSFLAFRKLEQDVQRWNDLVVNNFESAGCDSADQCGAKLMGRWKSGRYHLVGATTSLAKIGLTPINRSSYHPISRERPRIRYTHKRFQI